MLWSLTAVISVKLTNPQFEGQTKQNSNSSMSGSREGYARMFLKVF